MAADRQTKTGEPKDTMEAPMAPSPGCRGLGGVYLSWGQPLYFSWFTVMIALAISARA